MNAFALGFSRTQHMELSKIREVLQERLPVEIADEIIDYMYPIQHVIAESPDGWDPDGLRFVHNIRHSVNPVWREDVSLFPQLLRNARFLHVPTDNSKLIYSLFFCPKGFCIALQVMPLPSVEELRLLRACLLRTRFESKDFESSIIVNPTLRDEHLIFIEEYLDHNNNTIPRENLLHLFWNSNNAVARKHFGRLRMWEYLVEGLSMEDAMALCNDEQREAFSKALVTQRSVRLCFAPLTEEIVRGPLSSEELVRVSMNTTMRKDYIPLRTDWDMNLLAQKIGPAIYDYIPLTPYGYAISVMFERKDILFAKHTAFEMDENQWFHAIRLILETENDFRKLDDSVWTQTHFRRALLRNPLIMTDWMIQKARIQNHEVRLLWRVTDDVLRGRMDWDWNWDGISLFGKFSWSFVRETISSGRWNKTLLSWRADPKF